MTYGDEIGQAAEAGLNDVNKADTSFNMLNSNFEKFKQMMGDQRLGFLYERWRTHPACPNRWSTKVFGGGPEEGEEENGGMYKLRDINWGVLWESQLRVRHVSDAAGQLDVVAGRTAGRLDAAWKGKAGDAAQQRIADISTAAKIFQENTDRLSKAVFGARETSRTAIENLANFFVAEGPGGKLMSTYATLGGNDDTGNEFRGDYSRYMDEMKRIIGKEFGGEGKGTYRGGWNAHEEVDQGGLATNVFAAEGVSFGRVMQSPGSMRQPAEVKLTDGDNRWSDQICKDLDDLCNWYSTTMDAFRAAVRKTIDDVTGAWDGINEEASQVMADNPDPFAKLQLPGQDPAPEDTEQPKNEDTQQQDPPNTKTDTGSGVDPGTTAASYQPTDTPPGTDPNAVDPTTGQDPSAQPSAGPSTQPGAHPETVSIKDGDREISVQSPDGQGHVKVTVDDGTGPKSYDLDFGDGTTGTDPAADPSQTPGATGQQPGQQGPTTGQTPDQPGAVDDGTGQPAEQVQAGPDGKAVIHDGPVTITAEHPEGSPDQLTITVDDGTGHPQTYTVDYTDPGADTSGAETADTQNGVTTDPNQLRSTDSGPQPIQDQPQTSQPASYGAQPANQVQAGDAQYQPEQPANVQTTSAQSDFAGAGAAPAQGFAGGSMAGDSGGFVAQDSGANGLGNGEVSSASAPGEAHLAGAADAHHQAGAGNQSGAMGGMPMMGGGMGQGGGEESERAAATSWRIVGNLFDDDYTPPGGAADGVLGDGGH